MLGVTLILELFVSIFLVSMGTMFIILEVAETGPVDLGALAIAGAFCFVGLILGSHAFGRLRTRGLLLAGAGVFGLAALGGLLELAVLGVTAWLAVVVIGLAGILACLVRLRGLE